jgi:hypothetical protein
VLSALTVRAASKSQLDRDLRRNLAYYSAYIELI